MYKTVLKQKTKLKKIQIFSSDIYFKEGHLGLPSKVDYAVDKIIDSNDRRTEEHFHTNNILLLQ